MAFTTDVWPDDNPWYKARYLKLRIYQANRRAALYGTAGVLTVPDWEHVLQAFQEHCAHYQSAHYLIMEHIIPFAEGGTNTPDNLQPLCRDCHAHKTGNENSARFQRYIATQKGL